MNLDDLVKYGKSFVGQAVSKVKDLDMTDIKQKSGTIIGKASELTTNVVDAFKEIVKRETEDREYICNPEFLTDEEAIHYIAETVARNKLVRSKIKKYPADEYIEIDEEELSKEIVKLEAIYMSELKKGNIYDILKLSRLTVDSSILNIDCITFTNITCELVDGKHPNVRVYTKY